VKRARKLVPVVTPDTQREPEPEKENLQQLIEAVKDVCWKATPCGQTPDGDTAMYVVPKGALHRLVGIGQSFGSVALRDDAGLGPVILADAVAGNVRHEAYIAGWRDGARDTRNAR
jgi:hypothetical protein